MKQTKYANTAIIIFAAAVLLGIGYWSYSQQSNSPKTKEVVSQEPSAQKTLSANNDIDAALRDILASEGLTSLDTLDCSKLSDTALIKLGDAVMAPITGDEAHHSAMENMMGGEESVTAKAMHSAMGKAYLGCAPGINTAMNDSSGMGMPGMKMTTMTDANIMSLITIKRSAAIGDLLIDAEGMTLYTFDNDTAGVSNCDGDCATTWPPFASIKKPTDLSTLYEHLGTIVRKDGSFQFTWKGSPLYFYKEDTKVGDTNGEGVKGVWHIVHL